MITDITNFDTISHHVAKYAAGQLETRCGVRRAFTVYPIKSGTWARARALPNAGLPSSRLHFIKNLILNFIKTFKILLYIFYIYYKIKFNYFHAQFRTPRQGEAARLAAAKETPLVAVLPTRGKSLVFIAYAVRVWG